MPRIVAAALAYAPAALVLAGLGGWLVGWLPRAATAAWAALALCFVIGWLGTVLQFPDWVEQASPYSHVPLVPAEGLTWTPLLWLTGISVASVTVGITKLAKCDIA